MPGQEKIERTAQAIDVGPAVHAVTVQGLLRGKIVGRAQHVFVKGHGKRGMLVAGESGQAQVQHLDHFFLIDQKIGGFDVAVDQAGLVGMVQPVGRLADEVGGDKIIHRSVAFDHLLQVAALDVLHYHVVDVAVVVNVVRADDVAMIQLGDGLGLAVESGQIGRVFHAVFGQHLDGHAPLHEHVFGQVHAAHSARAQVVQELIFAQEKAFMPAFKDVVALPAGKQAGLDKLFGDDIGLGRQRTARLLLNIGQDSV